MANTTFSGPIRAGNIRNTIGTTVGTDVANVGYVVTCQDALQTLAGGAVAAVATNIVIPANSKIVNIIVDMVSAANTTTNISVGQVGGGASTFINTLASGTTVGIKPLNIVIPANSKIVNIIVDMVSAANTTTNISVGQVGGGASTFINALASGTTVGIKPLGVSGGGTLAWGNTGTSDLRLNITGSAATNAGSVRITVMYAQAFNTTIQP